MQALGNDFVIIELISQIFDFNTLNISQLADRRTGIGFDQLILINKGPQANFSCRIFNSDGTEAEQCGNGLRCVAKLVYDLDFTKELSFTIETKAGIFTVSINSNLTITISMGHPIFEPTLIPFVTKTQNKSYLLPLTNCDVTIAVLSMGNPHAILQTSHSNELLIQKNAAEIASHKAFPQGINLGFMEILNRNTIRLRTFERGVGETYACGSNACAAVVAGIINGTLDHKVKVELALGSLEIEWDEKNEPVMMTGPADYVFEGWLAF